MSYSYSPQERHLSTAIHYRRFHHLKCHGTETVATARDIKVLKINNIRPSFCTIFIHCDKKITPNTLRSPRAQISGILDVCHE
jgi:hypothetical protein